MESKTRFDKASKRFDETHVLFASRLHNELRYYLSSRGVDNFEKLCNLLVSDKLKSCLAPVTLSYVRRRGLLRARSSGEVVRYVY